MFPAAVRLRTVIASMVVLTALSGAAGFGGAAVAAADDCVDTFDCFRLSYSFNNQTPFDQPRTLNFGTDTSAYTLQTNERRKCLAPNNTVIWGNKSAWWRFDS